MWSWQVGRGDGSSGERVRAKTGLAAISYRQSSCLGSGWEYLREGAEREEWWSKYRKTKCKREKGKKSPKEQTRYGQRESTMMLTWRWQSSTRRACPAGQMKQNWGREDLKNVHGLYSLTQTLKWLFLKDSVIIVFLGIWYIVNIW